MSKPLRTSITETSSSEINSSLTLSPSNPSTFPAALFPPQFSPVQLFFPFFKTANTLPYFAKGFIFHFPTEPSPKTLSSCSTISSKSLLSLSWESSLI